MQRSGGGAVSREINVNSRRPLIPNVITLEEQFALRFSTKTMLGLTALIALLLVPVAWLLNHSTTWGPAEHTANVLHSLAGEIIENDLTETEIIELLKSPDLKHHAIHEIHAKIEKKPNELIWFAPNNKYTVGLAKDGAVIWMVDGKRSGAD